MRSYASDEVVANIFARAYRDTGSIADAFWVTESTVRRHYTIDVGATGLNRLIAEVSAEMGVRPEKILGTTRAPLAKVARYEVWRRARRLDPPLSYPALGAAFGRHHTTIIEALSRYEARLAERQDQAQPQERAA